MRDHYHRLIDYMRVSITDRCNLRCLYCMPEGIELLPMEEILTYDEILEIIRCAAQLGIRKIKVTGGEPLVRKDCSVLIKEIKKIPGIEKVTLTTNGILLKAVINDLKEAGIDGINISLDTLDPLKYQKITGFDMLEKVKEGIDCSLQAGIPTKINTVLQKNSNEDDWKELMLLAKEQPLDVRFIELMPIGYGDKTLGINNHELLKEIEELYPGVQKDTRIHGNGPAVYITIPGFQGSIGFISAVNDKFCDTCNRIRLTSTGKIKPCLCYGDTFDLREILRSEEGTAELLKKRLQDAIVYKPKEHCFEKLSKITEKKKMRQIGG